MDGSENNVIKVDFSKTVLDSTRKKSLYKKVSINTIEIIELKTVLDKFYNRDGKR